MKIEDLQKAWDKYSSKDTIQLDEDAIKEMLGKRTKSLIERIDRNVKIGFGVLLALILYIIIDYFVIYPNFKNVNGVELDIPTWIIVMDLLSNLFIITTFIYFAITYFRVKNRCSVICNLKDTLIRIISILKLYERLFFFALIIILLSVSVSYIFGLQFGLITQAKEQGMELSELGTTQIAITLVIGVMFLVLMAGGLFLLFRWGFRRLYGNYLFRLKMTLKELNEID